MDRVALSTTPSSPLTRSPRHRVSSGPAVTSLPMTSSSGLWRSSILCVILTFALVISPASSSSSSTSGYSVSSLRDIFSSALLSKSSYLSSPSSSSSSSASNTTLTTTLSDLVTWLRLDSTTPPSHAHCLLNQSTSPETAARCIVSQGKCLTLGELSDLYSKDLESTLTPSETASLSPALLYHVMSCRYELRQETDEGTPSSLASWGYSFLFVTIINLLSVTGALVLPCMTLNSYKVILMFMVALAVGTLAGSGLLFLLPEAFELDEEHNPHFAWKSTTVMGGIYLFFLLEKLLRSVNNRRENTRLKKRRDEEATAGQITSSFTRKAIDNALPERNLESALESMQHSDRMCSGHHGTQEGSNGDGPSHQEISNSTATTPDDHPHTKTNGHASPTPNPSDQDRVAPVAYMIIFGDALHNFIDGLSIGSAFTKSIMTGISISVAVMCEELPHELGDFAILLNSGMRVRKALCYNFLSALTCYLGTAIGIALGENTQSHTWIFALAGGMFLYISLVDMLPEMNAAAESPEGKRLGSSKVFLIQNLGLLTGFGIMLVFALFGHNISFE